MNRSIVSLSSLSLLLSSACSSEEDFSYGTISSESSIEGRWVSPADVLAVGDGQDVLYTGAGRWAGESSCQGSLTTGAGLLKEYIKEFYPQVSSISGYSCRHINGNASQTSVHATGRALDIHIPTDSGQADNGLGDSIANWLIVNAETIGVQYLIWDRTSWNPSRRDGSKQRKYTGAHKHHDHLHVELSLEGGRAETDFFSESWEAPQQPNCGEIPAQGATIDNDDACMQLIGPIDKWRKEKSGGFDRTFVWTNIFQSDTYSNAALWQINLKEAGDYQVEVYLPAVFSQYSMAEYEIRHQGQNTKITIDQSESTKWKSLGVFAFDTTSGQKVTLFDNSNKIVAQNIHIAADALRLTRVPDHVSDPEKDDPEKDDDAAEREPEANAEGSDDTKKEEEGNPSLDLHGGCQTGGQKSSTAMLLVLSMMALFLRKRTNLKIKS